MVEFLKGEHFAQCMNFIDSTFIMKKKIVNKITLSEAQNAFVTS